MSFITISAPGVAGALFPLKDGSASATIKVYGVASPVLMEGFIGANEVKAEDGSYRPSAFGRLSVKAAKTKSKSGEDYLHLQVEGGLQGRLFKVDGKDFQYSGAIDAGDGTEIALFGRRRKSESGAAFVAISSGERRAKEASSAQAKSAPQPAQADDEDILPF